MKICQDCGQMLAEEMVMCPTCGNEVDEGRKFIDDYRILEVIHEGYSTTLCKAVKDDDHNAPVMIRIFTPQSGINEKIAGRLRLELEALKKLPERYFVKHLEIRKSDEGLWYRVSEWIDAKKWGTLLASGDLRDRKKTLDLFYKVASILEQLHKAGHFMPRLVLDDIIVFQGNQDELEVKIDYKLSRFLDTQMHRPGPMLANLEACHPDIVNNRPLDFRTDVWSLGKIFIEVLTADLKITDYQKKIEGLKLPNKFKVLLKIMVADDPDLRLRSMDEVAQALVNARGTINETGDQSHRKLIPSQMLEIRGLKKRVSILAIIMIMILMVRGFAWFYSDENKNEKAEIEDYVKKYAGSVAFVMTEYQIKDTGTVLYRNRTEGTAFLVDKDGFLLTNRHVACPWLEDNRMFSYINNFISLGRQLEFEYRIYLWFEGERAFKRIPDLSGEGDVDDIYFLESAFSTIGKSKLVIAGVAKSPEKTWQLIKSPLKDDYAVLKIDHVPEGLIPLPLDHEMEALKIPRLSSVITLGFPLGSKTQANTVNLSVTTGHVRRTFEDVIQVDTSIYRGNSGGPLIDTNGKVIGITSSVALEWASGPVAVATRLSDLGMVLPISKASSFLQELKDGKVKWNGVLDLSVERKLKHISELAKQGRWVEAEALSDKELELSMDPTLVMASAMMHFCSRDYNKARELYAQAISIESENDIAKLMHYIIDWSKDQSYSNAYRKELLALDWRSSAEFFGHLVRIIEGFIDEKIALKGGYTEDEHGWVNFIAGLIHEKQKNMKHSEMYMKKAVLATTSSNWLYYLASSKLDQIQQLRLTSIRSKAAKTRYKKEINKFTDIIVRNETKTEARAEKLAPLIFKLEDGTISPGDRHNILKQIFDINGKNGEILVGLVFYSAMDSSWEQALKYARLYLDIQGRETAGRLGVGLLEAEVLHFVGREKEAMERLEEYNNHTADPWYRAIGECLLKKQSETSLTKKAGKNPEYLVTAHTALGFWAEGSRDSKKASKLYKEALGSYMDDMFEYEFAVERIKKINETSKK